MWTPNQIYALGRYILDYTGPLHVDHVNRNKFDNRKENLRLVSTEQSAWNRGPRKDYKYSKYKGVKINSNGKWEARLRKNGKSYSRVAKTEEEAALKYNALARKHHGEYAYQNIIDTSHH